MEKTYTIEQIRQYLSRFDEMGTKLAVWGLSEIDNILKEDEDDTDIDLQE